MRIHLRRHAEPCANWEDSESGKTITAAFREVKRIRRFCMQKAMSAGGWRFAFGVWRLTFGGG
jgi:hypothetical protein